MKRYNQSDLSTFLAYEIHSSFICKYINIKWMQEVAAWYYGNLARRKYQRYLLSMQKREEYLGK